MTTTGCCHWGKADDLLDDFDAALGSITVIDGEHLW